MYTEFLKNKMQNDRYAGFTPESLPEFLYDFQRDIVEWSLKKGKGAIFADCGLGKTPMQLVWADQVARRSGKPVLIATPLAVSHQLVREAEKFGLDCARSQSGEVSTQIVATNYERLHLFNPLDFSGMVCDESSILKNFSGVRKSEVTEFMRRMEYRLLCTATASPNDYTELGTSSEAVGELGHVDMLNRFFKNTNNTSDLKGHWRGFGAPRAFRGQQWRFKGHAEDHFWRWVCSWARALRKPSDMGYNDDRFKLPPLTENQHKVQARTTRPDMLFNLPAVGLQEQREERRRTIQERCEMVGELVSHTKQALVWCHLNAEGDLLNSIIPDAEQVRGSDTDDIKESRLLAFARGDLRVLVTKPKIGAWGLNLQNCSHVTFFPSHSYEQYYQGVRRCWRFGQENPVTVDVVTTEGEQEVMKNLQRKAVQADRMFESLVAHMQNALSIRRDNSSFTKTMEAPEWLSPISG